MERRSPSGASVRSHPDSRDLHLRVTRSSIILMLKKTLIGACLALCVAGCATSPSTSGTGKPETAATTQAAATTKALPAGCVSETGTRIPVSQSDCTGPGRVWTNQDVKSTGATDAAQALRQLDPTVTISH